MEQVNCYLVYSWYLIQSSNGTYDAVHRDFQWGEEYNWNHLTIPEDKEDDWDNTEHYTWESPEAFKDWYDHWKLISDTAEGI
jgi:hypothetical protein